MNELSRKIYNVSHIERVQFYAHYQKELQKSRCIGKENMRDNKNSLRNSSINILVQPAAGKVTRILSFVLVFKTRVSLSISCDL